ncbi:uncharacterized protein EHS24_007284 [Apiotrichum porosum]|uniref:UNC-45/Cro1/She4 central domain-containing protein n=1 Tax=Apiotrichum porosum TaxID=105984 RepID=A0A427XXJ0_9TREE|nr:uncharacterized protein EHS24_007284 [Apiotrichum porosum]RSH83596.1 hypothetical protein EHS24_007284 [Apiotrichum porosum]
MSQVDLKALLKQLSSPDADATTIVTPQRVRELAAAISPSASHDDQSFALLSVSKIVDVASQDGTPDEVALRIKHIFDPLVADALSTDSADPVSLVPATSLLAVVAQTAPKAVVAILTQHLGLDDNDDKESTVDPLSLLLELAELPSSLQPAFAGLLSSLAGTKAGRDLVRNRALEWLSAAAEAETKQVQGDTKVLCAVTLSKLGREDPVVGEKPEERAVKDEEAEENESRFARTLAAHIAASSASSRSDGILPSLEGLSVLSTRPFIRDILAADSAFLKGLLALSPVPQAAGGSLPVTPRASMSSLDQLATAPVDTALCYGVVTILSNLTQRKAVLSEQDQQMARLRRMAISGKGAADGGDDPRESDNAAKARTDLVVAAGVLGALRGLVRAESTRVRAGLGALCRDIVEDKAQRVPFIRDGGVKILTIILRDMKDAEDKIAPAQGLAKLVITTPPQLLFPAPYQTNALNALHPLYLLLVHPNSSLLQKFESLMALTNLASIDPQFGSRIVAANMTPPESNEFRGADRSTTVPVVSKVEELLLDDNTLVRRAATELVCNLVTSEAGFSYFSGDQAGSPDPDPRAASRLGVLLLLTDVDDLATRLAASGALAVLTESVVACKLLLSGAGISSTSKRNAWERLGDLFEPGGAVPEIGEDGERLETVSSSPPDAGLAHRAAVIIENLARFCNAEDEEQLKKGQAALEGKIEAAVKAFIPTKDRPADPRVDVAGVVKALLEARKTLAGE